MKRYTGIHKDFLYILIISIMSMYYSQPAPPNKKILIYYLDVLAIFSSLRALI